MSNEVFIQDSNQSILTNATVTSNGSTVVTGYGFQEINLVINIKAAPTGTTPTITFTLQEVDPGDKTTIMGSSTTTTALSGVGVTIAALNTTTSGSVKVSWTVGGTAPSFTQLYATVVAKATPSSQQTTAVSSSATTGVSFGRVLYGGSASVLTAIRATTYTEQTTNFTGSVKSTSANDASAGTGARTVIITYYDQTGAGPLTETVTLNGTTAVNLVNTNHCFIEKMVVVTVGSTGSNAGTISLFTGTGGTGTTVGSIGFGTITSTIGDNTTLWAHHYTPVGKTTSYYLYNVGTTGNQTANHFLRSQAVLTTNSAEVQISDILVTAASSNSVSRDLVAPAKVTGFARTTAYVVSNGTNTNFFAGFDYSDS